MDNKKRKLSLSGSLPVDCIGEICEFVSSTCTFFKLYSLSQYTRWYFDNENPSSCKNIVFVAKKCGFIVIRDKNYVIKIKVKYCRGFPVKFFPRVVNMKITKEWSCGKGIAGYFGNFPSLQHLQRLTIAFNAPITELDFGYLIHVPRICLIGSQLKQTKSRKDVTDMGLGKLVNIEHLCINGFSGITGSCFQFMPKLRVLHVECCFDLDSGNFRFLPNLEELHMRTEFGHFYGHKNRNHGTQSYYLGKYQDMKFEDFSYLTNLRRLFVSNILNFGLGFQKLKPGNLQELFVNQWASNFRDPRISKTLFLSKCYKSLTKLCFPFFGNISWDKNQISEIMEGLVNLKVLFVIPKKKTWCSRTLFPLVARSRIENLGIWFTYGWNKLDGDDLKGLAGAKELREIYVYGDYDISIAQVKAFVSETVTNLREISFSKYDQGKYPQSVPEEEKEQKRKNELILGKFDDDDVRMKCRMVGTVRIVSYRHADDHQFFREIRSMFQDSSAIFEVQ